ncbi:glucosamine-6-phosphate deaminase [Filifactor villosus]|uniref:Glucosamine-6-phosphate deaminase n=1 Tax=Filifactor villosus TaxID=29374 RepID=A0ABV9QNF9_9FIRM
MRIWYAKDYNKMSKMAAAIVASQVTLKPSSVLAFITGSTPIGTYKELIRKYEEEEVDFSSAKVMNIDEYVGLSKTSDQSYSYFMYHNLYKYINVFEENTLMFRGENLELDKECQRMEANLKRFGTIDLHLLGIGRNGHVAFNEPSDSFSKGIRHVELSNETIEDNSRFFDTRSDVPKRAYTFGIRTIMSAKRILLLASGEAKQEILYKALFGPITPAVPASVLQLHPDVDVIADEKALKEVIQRMPEEIVNLRR